MDPEEAWLRLRSGNERFALNEPVHPHESLSWRRHMAHSARPFAAILGCSDPASPPELLFDQGIGDLFVIRVAGNVVADDVLGSLQFAGAHLGTRLFVVLGHEGCQTVRVALEEHCGRGRQAGRLESVVHLILPALAHLPHRGDVSALMTEAVEANVRHSTRRVAAMTEARKALEQRRIKVVAAMAQPETGRVRWLDDAAFAGAPNSDSARTC